MWPLKMAHLQCSIWLYFFSCCCLSLGRWWRKRTLRSQWEWFAEWMASTRWWNTVRSPWRPLRSEAQMDACYSMRGILPTTSSPYHFWEMLSSTSKMGAFKIFLVLLIRNWVTWEAVRHPKSKLYRIHLLPWGSPLSSGNFFSRFSCFFGKIHYRV